VSSPKKFTITESIATLKAYQKSSIPMIATRIRALIEFKIHEKTGISKRATIRTQKKEYLLKNLSTL
jgi:hypothetical protein